ncbi:flagellar basal body-associated protein FliL [Alginatibacterium sediminis]|uniref:Flagellar protein FliL n=1 Tax=Alginatibacterium sediminis TaxID=2164068 RepID=A0A420EFZ0_9ALTE|nr:flagellar basal body-associated protein FliL [Alginatibacterium sediminis]RKF19486.1 flagellar basal body-associated protein FliL [Alginatibacterium sediminis]
MADDKELLVEDGKEGKGKKKLIIIIAGVVVLLAVLAGVWFMFFSSDDAAPAASADPNAQQATAVTATAHYVGMPRPFVFNVRSDIRDRLVQIKVQLLVRGASNEALTKQHIPLIESTLLDTFSSASVSELSSVEGKELVRQQSLENVQKKLNDLTGSVVIEKVLFTGFVMQ